MKLTAKLSLAIALGIFAVLAVHAWLRVEQDIRVYRNDVVRDHQVIGRSLAATVEFIWQTEGEARARELVEALDLRYPHLAIRWVWTDPADGGEYDQPLDPAQLRGTSASDDFASRIQEGPSIAPRVLSYATVDVPGERPGAIEIVESLEGEREFVRATLIRTTVTTSVLILLCLGLTLGFGFVFVARPMRMLAAKARQVGGGDLSGSLPLGSNDEIREVAIAMNEMAEKLEAAAARVQAESDARVRAVDELRHLDRLRTVGELASGVAHELGTPLNTVRARGSMIASAEVSPERARELGQIIVSQADRMTVIIRGLLDLARRRAPERRDEDLVALVQRTVEVLEPIAKRSRVRVEVRGPGGPVRAAVDAGQIEQAITNLVVNAIHAAPPEGHVLVDVDGDERTVSIAVEDDGPGIPDEHLARVFEPFFTTKRTGEGTGLGLSVSEGIAREHGGRIEAGQRAEGGARFVIHLPRAARVPSDASQPGRAP